MSEDDSEDESEFKRYVTRPKAIKKFTGHRNARTMMKEATWWGNNFVLSGSDCGHIFGWERSTEELVFLQVCDSSIKSLSYAILIKAILFVTYQFLLLVFDFRKLIGTLSIVSSLILTSH